MTNEPHPDLDRSVSRRIGTVGDDARVMRTAAALEANGISVLRGADSADSKLSAVRQTTDPRTIEGGTK
jgi:hypothetical protein